MVEQCLAPAVELVLYFLGYPLPVFNSDGFTKFYACTNEFRAEIYLPHTLRAIHENQRLVRMVFF